jgi:exodeoxyribonuclease VII large subunit
VPVQGEGAAERIARAISAFSALPEGDAMRPDVLIVARGGGSLEDLMAFNDEAVVRAAALCTIPLISAVGHETDTTLIDFASDRRAPTPTAAAELAVPSRIELLDSVAHCAARLASSLSRLLSAAKLRLREAERHLPDLPALLREARQRLDDRAERHANALPAFIAARRATLDRLAGRLPHPRERIAAGRASLSLATAKLAAEARALLREARTTTANLGARLEAVSYERVLARGFVLVEDARGHPVTVAAAVKPGARLSLHFADGKRGVTADRAPAGQGTLL